MRTAPSRRSHRMRRQLIGVATMSIALGGAQIAAACSQDNATYLESFLDTSCLATPLNNTGLDALGGLRLDSNGALTGKVWGTDTAFAGEVAFPRVGVSTLATVGTGEAASLQLPATDLPLAVDPDAPVLGPTIGAVLDGDNVGGSSVVKTGPSSYVMYYTGTAEAGGPTVILRATSTDGKAWTRAATPNTAVLTPTAGAFDEAGVGAPDVRFDPSEPLRPFRMWYSGRGKVFGAIGYATSLDGITWTKYTGSDVPAAPPVPVLDHGQGGSGDSFSAADPSVIKDGSVYKMWYTGDDSNRKRINYATSVDGIVWQKGGTVLGPESPNVTANFSEGAYAPVVWKSGATYTLLFSGRKFVSGSTYQTKIQSSTSTDGITWGSVGVGLNPAGQVSKFDNSNLEAPTLLDEGVAGGERFKLYYTGNTLDANGNGHDRIGLATSSDGNSFAKFNGTGTGDSVLDIGTLETAFDARTASGLSVTATPGGADKYVGFYSGARGSDFLPRIGEAKSSDLASWTKIAGSGAGGALFDLGTADAKGATDPVAIVDGADYRMYYSAVDAGGVKTIRTTTSPVDGATKLPTNAWTARATVLDATSGSSGAISAAGGVSHPSVLNVGGTFHLYYTAYDASGTPRIGLVTSASASMSSPTAAQLVLAAGGTPTDQNGAKDPVAIQLDTNDFRMIYTGVDADGIERLSYATSTDGVSWTRGGVVQNPSRMGFAFDEIGLRASGFADDGASLHVFASGVDRTGRMRSSHASVAVPVTAGQIPMGWATYQLGDGTAARDFRSIARTSSGDGVELWMSFLQPYSGGTQYWSQFFPVTTLGAQEELNLLLTVKAIRWQARLSNPTGSPAIDAVTVNHAPVSFATSGGATSLEVRPPSTLIATAWTSLLVKSSLFQPTGGGSGAGSVTVKDAASGAVLVAPTPLTIPGDTTVGLAGVSAVTSPALKVEFALTSDGSATPLIKSYSVGYASIPKPTDTTAPTGVLVTGPASLSKAFQVTPSLKVTWTGVDAESGIAKFELVSRSAPIGGAFGPASVSPLGLTTASSFVIKPGSTYCFKIRATNGAAMATDSPERCTAQPLKVYSMSAKGIWAKKTGSGFYFKQFRRATAKGATLSKTGVTVKRLALVATKLKGGGSVTVYLGTTKLRTVSLAATTTKKRQLIPIANFSKVKKGTIRIVVASTGKPVIIEGLAVSKK